MRKLLQIWNVIVVLWNRIWGNYETEDEKILKENARKAVRIVNIIKSVVENPLLDIFTSLTKTDADDKILFIVRKVLRDVSFILEQPTIRSPTDELQPNIPVADPEVQVKISIAEELRQSVALIRSMNPQLQNVVYQKIGRSILKELDRNYMIGEAELAGMIEWAVLDTKQAGEAV